MGSWNFTCALSELPICSGDKVKWLLVTQTPYIDHKQKINVYSEDLWSVRTLPVDCVYEDYGYVGLDQTTVDSLNFKIWKHGCEIQKIDSFDPVYQNNSLIWEVDRVYKTPYRWYNGHEPELNKNPPDEFGNIYPPDYLPTTGVLILDNVWNEYLQIKKQSKTRSWDNLDNNWLEKAENSFEYFRDEILLKKHNPGFRDWILRDMDHPFHAYTPEDKNSVKLKQQMWWKDHVPYVLGCEEYLDYWFKHRTETSMFEDIKQLFILKSQLDHVGTVMTLTRKKWEVKSGAGSQCDDYSLYVDLFNRLKKTASTLNKERNKKYYG